jgi:pyruvoyl-dependent arginine decarboxylase (PvlArgDC)
VTSILLQYYIGEFNTTLVSSILPQYSGMYWVVLSLNTTQYY